MIVIFLTLYSSLCSTACSIPAVRLSLRRVLVDVEVLSSALELSRAVLLKDPCQLASQLMGRLGQMVIEDRPVAKGKFLQNQPLNCQSSIF